MAQKDYVPSELYPPPKDDLNLLCIEPELNSTVDTLNIALFGPSREFEDMNNDTNQLLSLFREPGSALVISGLDGVTTDIQCILQFLNSSQHQHKVEMFCIDGGDPQVRASSLDLQFSLQEWLYPIQQLTPHPSTSPSIASSSASSPTSLE
jgi:hypothetical protein